MKPDSHIVLIDSSASESALSRAFYEFFRITCRRKHLDIGERLYIRDFFDCAFTDLTALERHKLHNWLSLFIRSRYYRKKFEFRVIDRLNLQNCQEIARLLFDKTL